MSSIIKDPPPLAPPDLPSPTTNENSTTNKNPSHIPTRNLPNPTKTTNGNPNQPSISSDGNMNQSSDTTNEPPATNLPSPSLSKEEGESDSQEHTPAEDTTEKHGKIEAENCETQSMYTTKLNAQGFPKVSSNYDKIYLNKKSNLKENDNETDSTKENQPNPTTRQQQNPATTKNANAGNKAPQTAMNRQSNPGTSKPTFAAAVQAKVAVMNFDKPPVTIKHGTHLGKPTVFFTVEDYL